MKRWIRNILHICLLLFASMIICNCSDENEQYRNESSEQKVWKLNVSANKVTDTRVLTDNGSSLIATWATTDVVDVLNSNSGNVGTLQPTSAGTTVILTGTLTGSYNVGDALTLWYPSSTVSYIGQDGTLATLSSSFDYSKADVQISAANTQNGVLTTNSASFVSQQAIGKFQFTDGTNTLSVASVKITCATVTNSPLTITNANNTKTDPLYIAIQQTNNASSSYLFEVTTTTGETYAGFFNANLTNGTYYGNITLALSAVNAPTAVDLGLSVKWADMNVGALTEGDYGWYFAWAGTTGYSSSNTTGTPFTPANAPYSVAVAKYDNQGNFSNYTYGFSKYVNDFWNQSLGIALDYRTTLEASDDAATANWGTPWRMPTEAEIQELIATKTNTTGYTWQWTTSNGTDGTPHNGWRITSNMPGTAGNSIFLPAAGFSWRYDLQNEVGRYWSSTVIDYDSQYAAGFVFNCNYAVRDTTYRAVGSPVRPVRP